MTTGTFTYNALRAIGSQGIVVKCTAAIFFLAVDYKHKTKQQKNICIELKVLIRINFDPDLALTGFRTILPCF